MTKGGPKDLFQVYIAGSTGYAGQALHALMMHHPCIEPHIVSVREPEALGSIEREALAQADAICLALPHAPATIWAEALGELGTRRVLDLSDARRRDADVHYGIPELFGAPDPKQRFVANPGCYPTATLLSLRPLLDAGLIDAEPIAVLGTSGASGAGKGLAERLHFCNLSANSFPYKVGEHRHIPEIEHHLGRGLELDARISFVTQLLPLVRGMLVTSFVQPRAGVSPQQLQSCLREHYAPHPYVSVLDEPGEGLGLGHVVGTHQALIAVGPVARGGLVPVFGAIDNLMRGAASIALHNLNLWLGLDPALGLPPPLSPLPHGIPPMFATRSTHAST